MPKIEHVALWCCDLERMKDFYLQYFADTAGAKYENQKKGFTSYFLSFEDGSRLELMRRNDIDQAISSEKLGWAHLAFSVGTKAAVDQVTAKLAAAGYEVTGKPRTTGDGYYESVVLDPEGNQIEITI